MLTIPYEFLAMLAGFIDGDGYFQIVRSGNYIKINLIISLDPRDLSLLQYFHRILGIGRIDTSSSDGTVKFIVSKTELQEILIPLFIHHGIFFLTHNRINQFNLLMYILNNNIIYWEDLPSNVPSVSPSCRPLCGRDIALPFFTNWIVGFTMAEGSFYHKNNGDSCFSLRQKQLGDHEILFIAFNLAFNTNKKINTTVGHFKFEVSSVKDLQLVINFFSFTSNIHPLMGYK